MLNPTTSTIRNLNRNFISDYSRGWKVLQELLGSPRIIESPGSFIHAGAGIGSWGTKISGGIRNESKSTNSFCYGIYLSRASGLSNFITQMETTSGTKDVTMDLYSGITLNPTIGYKWVMRKRHRFFLEGTICSTPAGFAI